MNCSSGIKEKGFTLIEIIVAIVVGAIMMAMLVVFMGTSITQSANPIIMVKEQNELNQVMEKIVEEYKARIAGSSLKLDTFYTWITGNYGSYVVDNGTPRYITFNASNVETSCTYGSAGCYGLKLALKKNYQTISGLFTE